MTQLTTRITDLLESVRQRIRRYVWIEGIAVAIAWVVGIYWIAFALDYLPVRLGANEMPATARMTLLVISALALLYVLYRWILRRAWAQLQDRSIALLIERKFPEFQDSLVTAVELDQSTDEHADPLHDELLAKARDRADRHAGSINVDRIFNYWPLRRAMTLAGTALVSILIFGVLAWPTFRLSLKRLYGLTDATYPRQTLLEMVDFEDGKMTVARGSDVTIRVQADATRSQPPPKVCTVHYQTASGEKGRMNMSKMGAPREGFQQYTLDSKPFKGILSDVKFDVIGNDYRIRNQSIAVVDSPQVVNVNIRCERPEYTGLAASDTAWFPGIKLPQGSRLNLDIETNKPLVSATIANVLDKENAQQLLPADATVEGAVEGAGDNSNHVLFPIDSFKETMRFEVTLADTDGVTSERPYLISIVAVPDTPPSIDLRLRGIGSAITPDAKIPVVGQVSDDYGITKSWFELEMPTISAGEKKPPLQFALDLKPTGDLDSALDLRQQRADPENPLTLQTDSKVILSVRASDRYDLDDVPNIGQGDRYELELVSPGQLIALLEAREISLRKRFVQIIDEMREMRDSLARVQFAPSADPEETSGALSDDEGAPTNSLERAIALRQLRVQRALQHTQRSTQEVLGVALSFDDIRMELVNNRIDAADRMERIENDIANPLKEISSALYPVLEDRLDRLDDFIEESRPENEISTGAVSALAGTDEILSLIHI